jgi:transposase
MSMAKRTGLSRGDARRNARLLRLRGVVRQDRAILAIDLADTTQVLAVCDHDSRVLARRSVRGHAWQLEEALRWGRQVAVERGFAGVVVGCEPTGHRWRIVAELCDRLGMELACVQPLLVARAREGEDLTGDKSDPKDAVLIGRLVGELRCYLPERADQVWARLRQLGARRVQLTTTAGACRQQLRDLLECAWPAVLQAAGEPLDSLTWRAAVQVALARSAGDPATLGRVGEARFARQVTRQLARWGGQRRCQRIVRAVWTAATSRKALALGVSSQRPGALERATLVLEDWHHALGQLTVTEQRMTGVLDQLQLTALVGSIPGLSAVGAAAILAETGDPARFDSARALVKHAGLCPRANQSGAYTGTTRISGRGRPALRLAAWRATWGALAHNPVLAARHRRRPARPPQGGNHPGRLRAADQRAGRARRLLGDHPASEHEQPRPSPPQARIQDVGTNPVGR